VILYLDTSALVKLYVAEDYSDIVQAAAKAADSLVSSALAYVEAHAAFARLRHEGLLSGPQHELARQRFREDWRDMRRVETGDSLLERAVELTEAFALRAYDSVHLAAADYLSRATNETLVFACHNAALNKAAKVLGMSLLERPVQ
jgi:predicted nucleic acid-binding protein